MRGEERGESKDRSERRGRVEEEREEGVREQLLYHNKRRQGGEKERVRNERG